MNAIRKNKTTVINFFGGPGTGKSSLAAQVFCMMKYKGLKCEYIREFAKELSYAGHLNTLEDQLYVTAVQHHRQWELYGKVDYIVADSPVMSGLVYDNQRFPSFPPLVLELTRATKNINILLRRPNVQTYETWGRHHSFKEAVQLDLDIEKMLIAHEIPFTGFESFETDAIINHIWVKLGV